VVRDEAKRWKLALFVLLLIVQNGSVSVAATTRPSFLVIVVDTLRRDAVSAYGSVAGTTPEMDALAAEGLRFTRAFAPSPWTLPSHATIFSGRRIDQHGVGLPGGTLLGTEWPTLAQSLKELGYETAAFSENVIVSDVFQLLRGFDFRKTSRLNAEGKEIMIDAPREVQAWLASRNKNTPFFVFVNMLDAHAPYEIRETNPWLPPGVSRSTLRMREARPELQLCGGLPTAEQIAIQRGLYLGDVHEADRKLGAIVRAIRAAAADTPLVTIAVSDHGELFGEGQLMGHEFSLHSGLLRIPVIVHGLANVAPAIIDTPVGLEDLMPSMLRWAGGPLPEDLPGRVLPTTIGPSTSDSPVETDAPRALLSAYTDVHRPMPEEWDGRVRRVDKNRIRQFCSDSNPVYGGMASLVRYPFKYVWYERYTARLYDLSWDLKEISDVSGHHPDLVRAFQAELDPILRRAGMAGPSKTATEIPQNVMDTLKALGYAE
jgi:arylsulfatase A-like enzyme